MTTENEIDWLEKFLSLFEPGAKKILNAYGDKVEEILKYREKNPFGDREKLKSARKILDCRHILWRCNRLRSSINQNNLRQIVYDTAWLGSLSYNVGLSKICNATWGAFQGGRASKMNKGLSLIIQEALQKSKIKTATGLWNYVKLEYRGNDFKSKYGTISFIDIDDPYWKHFKKEGILVAKKKRSRGRYLDVTKETFVPFNTFKRYVREVKGNAGTMET